MRTIAPLVTLTLGIIGSPLIGSAHAQNDIPQKVADKPGVVYEFGNSPIDGKPHKISVKAFDDISEAVRVNMPPVSDWVGEYPAVRKVGTNQPSRVSGQGFVMVRGDKVTYKNGRVDKDITLHLEIEPIADPIKLGSVIIRLIDASQLTQHMAECIRLAKAWSTPKGKAASYPRTAEIGKLICVGGYTLTLTILQAFEDSPSIVYFESSHNDVTVATHKLGDIDFLRRQVRRVQAWLENRPYIP